MSYAIHNNTDTAKWLTKLIGEWWPTTTEERNSSVYLTPKLAAMILEGAIGLETEQVEAKIAAMRRATDRYPGHKVIREALSSLRDATRRGEASAVGEDRREAARRLLGGKARLVAIAPGEIEVGEHTLYWLDRAARVLVHLDVRATESIDDVHRWHGLAVPEPDPVQGDPHFGKSSAPHWDATTRFLDAAANVVEYLGWERVGWRVWYPGTQLFAQFHRRDVSGDQHKRPGNAKAVRFYQPGDIRAAARRGNIDFTGIIEAAGERRRVLAIADEKGI